MQLVESRKCFGGVVNLYKHASQALGCEMKFRVFLPREAETKKVGALYFLAGLTCTEETFLTKSGAIEHASRFGMALICPDTSPSNIFSFDFRRCDDQGGQ